MGGGRQGERVWGRASIERMTTFGGGGREGGGRDIREAGLEMGRGGRDGGEEPHNIKLNHKWGRVKMKSIT